jgi:CubicO group peptidase (beta-lactamase class C family)
VPASVVNASYPLHLFVGLAWLFGSLAVEAGIARFAARPRVADVLYWVNERALTIYLWQAVGLFTMYQILWTRSHSAFTRDLLALPIVAAVTFLAVLLFGWLEDIAAGRPPRVWPTRSGSSGRLRVYLPIKSSVPAGAVLLVAITALFVAGRNVVQDPSSVVQAGSHTVPPSGVGLHKRAEMASIMNSAPPRPMSGRQGPVTPEELQLELEAWLEQWHLAGATASLLRPSGEGWTGAAGVSDSGFPFGVGEPYAIASVTKTFTAALVLRLADQKRLALDDKASKYVPDFPDADRFTIRQLLQHTSGLIPGGDLPHDALNEAAAMGLQFEPGKGYLYSRAGYYLLGLIVEDVTGKSYSQALRDDLLTPLELASTFMDEELLPLPFSTHPYQAAGDAYEGVLWTSGRLFRRLTEPTFDYQGALWSAGGLWSNTLDLSRWAVSLWGTEAVLTRSSREQMTTFLGKDFDYAGLGTYPFCPCWRERGQLKAERWGFVGVTGAVEYDPEDRVGLAIHMSGTILDENVLDALEDFSDRFRLLLRGRPILNGAP